MHSLAPINAHPGASSPDVSSGICTSDNTNR